MSAMFQPQSTPSCVQREILRFCGSKFTFVSQQLGFPNGTSAERQYILHPGGAMVLPVTAEGTFLCLKQYRFAIGCYIYEFPAGTLEVGETPAQTIHREIEEETGYRAVRWDSLGAFYLAPGYSDEIIYAYLARDLVQVPNPLAGDEDEDIEVVALTTEEISRLARTSLAFDAKSIAAFWRAVHFLEAETGSSEAMPV